MDSEVKCESDHDAPLLPIGLSNKSLKFEILGDGFLSSKGYLHDFQHLDNFPFAPSYNLDLWIQDKIFDPFDTVSRDASDFVLYEFKPSEENHNINAAAVQDFHSGGFFNFPDRKNNLLEFETALNFYDARRLNFVVPDENSAVNADEEGGMKSRSHLSNNQNKSESKLTKKPVRVLKKSKSAKGQWSIDEDRILIHLVEKYGERKWSHIAQMLKGRIGKQCRERWHNHLRPDIKKDIWSEEEDRVLIEAHAQVGNKWAEIVKSLPGRTENSIKNHWNATKRRQFSRRKCRTKWPKPSSLLQNYIKSLNFNKGNNMSSRTRKNGPVNKYVQNQEVQFQPEYDFESVPIFTYNEKSTVDSFMDDLSVNPPIKIDDQPCFDVGLPFDVPPLL